MITQEIMVWAYEIATWATGVVTGVFGLGDASWATADGTSFGWLVKAAAGLSSWVPFPLIASVVGTVLVVWVSGFGVKLFRAVFAHVPGIGGAG